MPRMTDYEKWLGPVEISAVPIPHDCTDGFLYAYWRRPAAYLDPRIRAAMSSFWMLDNVSEGLQKLASDLDKSVWRSEEHTSELQSLMRISYAVFCLKKKIIEHKLQY